MGKMEVGGGIFGPGGGGRVSFWSRLSRQRFCLAKVVVVGDMFGQDEDGRGSVLPRRR